MPLQAGWVPPPLAYIAELFGRLTPHEISLLLSAVYAYIKVSGAGYVGLVKGLGHNYSTVNKHVGDSLFKWPLKL